MSRTHTQDTKQFRILIVDDEPVNIQFLHQFFL